MKIRFVIVVSILLTPICMFAQGRLPVGPEFGKESKDLVGLFTTDPSSLECEKVPTLEEVKAAQFRTSLMILSLSA